MIETCKKCKGNIKISKATGDLFCVKCGYTLTSEDKKEILKRSYEIQKSK